VLRPHQQLSFGIFDPRKDIKQYGADMGGFFRFFAEKIIGRLKFAAARLFVFLMELICRIVFSA